MKLVIDLNIYVCLYVCIYMYIHIYLCLCVTRIHTHTHTFEEHLNAEVTIEGGIKHLKLVLCRPHWSDGPLLAVSCIQVFRLHDECNISEVVALIFLV